MINALCEEMNNWFTQDQDKHFGKFKIEGGELCPPFSLKDGQYYRIIGSVFNDGVHRFGDAELIDEEIEDGALWIMKIPPAVIELSKRIKTFEEKHGDATPYTSESFGGYSYTKATTSSGAPITWRQAFKKELNRWRKIR